VDVLSAWLLQVLLGDPFVLMIGMFLIIGIIEFLVPARKIPFRHYAFNAVYGLVTVFVAAIIAPVLSACTAYAIQYVGLGFIDLRALGFSDIAGSIVAVLVAALIFDFFFYWLHRLHHGNKFLWQQHLLHHCDEHMNVTSAARLHIFENFMTPVFVTIPMAILFKMPPVTIGILSLIPFAWIYFVHANVRLGFGPLWWLITSPQYHRIHHSLEKAHIDKNFVDWFPVWDILFGTAYRPRSGECPATGVAGVEVKTLKEAYLLPVKGWIKLLAPPPPRGGVSVSVRRQRMR
jgi:sterol desaturase/sphingolipid hydroxylase (fatty acid hydroxylase superfamily)